MLHDGPGLTAKLPSTRTLSLSVYVEVVKGHTLWHVYTANNVKISMIAARNRSLNGTTLQLNAYT